jgi:hypothetical protein
VQSASQHASQDRGDVKSHFARLRELLNQREAAVLKQVGLIHARPLPFSRGESAWAGRRDHTPSRVPPRWATTQLSSSSTYIAAVRKQVGEAHAQVVQQFKLRYGNIQHELRSLQGQQARTPRPPWAARRLLCPLAFRFEEALLRQLARFSPLPFLCNGRAEGVTQHGTQIGDVNRTKIEHLHNDISDFTASFQVPHHMPPPPPARMRPKHSSAETPHTSHGYMTVLPYQVAKVSDPAWRSGGWET